MEPSCILAVVFTLVLHHPWSVLAKSPSTQFERRIRIIRFRIMLVRPLRDVFLVGSCIILFLVIAIYKWGYSRVQVHGRAGGTTSLFVLFTETYRRRNGGGGGRGHQPPPPRFKGVLQPPPRLNVSPSLGSIHILINSATQVKFPSATSVSYLHNCVRIFEPISSLRILVIN